MIDTPDTSRHIGACPRQKNTIQNANCIYVLEKGVVAQRGSHAELMQQGGLYRELVTRQQAMEVAE